MNIGFLSEVLPYVPSRDGFRTYGGNLIRCMAQRHQIDLIALTTVDDENHLDWPQKFCRSELTISARTAALPVRCASLISSSIFGKPLHLRRRIAAALNSGLREGSWDVLHVEGAYIGGLVPADFPLPKVLSVHDSWTLRCQEMLKCNLPLHESAYFRLLQFHEPRYQRLVYPRFCRCVVVADRDRLEVNRIVPRAKVATIPYGTDLDYFHPVAAPKHPLLMVFHGNLGYPPNIAAALEFANHILPRILREEPQACFRLVAANPTPEVRALAGRPGIEMIESPPDVRPPVCSAAVYVCAIQHGTGMKTKMLEAMALQMPIVCYPDSAAGIDFIAGKHFFVAADAAEFALRVVHILRNPAEAQVMAAAARCLAEAEYSWDSRVRAFEELYAQILEEQSCSIPNAAERKDNTRKSLAWRDR